MALPKVANEAKYYGELPPEQASKYDDQNDLQESVKAQYHRLAQQAYEAWKKTRGALQNKSRNYFFNSLEPEERAKYGWRPANDPWFVEQWKTGQNPRSPNEAGYWDQYDLSARGNTGAAGGNGMRAMKEQYDKLQGPAYKGTEDQINQYLYGPQKSQEAMRFRRIQEIAQAQQAANERSGMYGRNPNLTNQQAWEQGQNNAMQEQQRRKRLMTDFGQLPPEEAIRRANPKDPRLPENRPQPQGTSQGTGRGNPGGGYWANKQTETKHSSTGGVSPSGPPAGGGGGFNYGAGFGGNSPSVNAPQPQGQQPPPQQAPQQQSSAVSRFVNTASQARDTGAATRSSPYANIRDPRR